MPDGDNVRYLPARDDVIDAEIVTPAMERERARRAVVRRDIATVSRVTRTVVTHDVTKTTGRNLAYVIGGVGVIVRDWWLIRTRADRTARAKELAGDEEGHRYWHEQSEKGKASRFDRWMRRLELAGRTVKMAGIGVVVWFFCLLVLGIILWATDSVESPFSLVIGFAEFIAWMFWLVSVSWVLLPVTLVTICVRLLWKAGKRAEVAPAWCARPESAPVDNAVTPLGVAAALANLKIPELKKAIKDGWQVEFLMVPTLVNGRGYQMVHSLPLGVTPAMVADCRDVYARNLHRAPLEVWPTAYEKDPVWVDTWVAHRGSTSRPGRPFPLLRDGTVDVFKGVPLGESQRGDQIAVPLPEASMGVGGLPGQGKSNAVRVIMAGAALDPLAILRVYVFAKNGDFDAFEPRLERYVRGTDDSVVTSAVTELRELYAEVDRREGRLAELGAKKLSRSIASQHADMRPIAVAFSECHELFGDKEFGEEASELAIVTVKRMRKTGIFIVFDTQSSRAAAIPSALVELFKYNACFAVKTWRSNDGFLGDGSFQAGIRATELRPGKDRGTSLVTGITEERFELLNWYYLEADDDTGYDAATEVVERAMKKAKVTKRPETAGEARDLLQDAHEAMGEDEEIRASHLADRLREMDLAYRSMDGVKLTKLLAAQGVEVKKKDGFPTVRAQRVLRALDAREGVPWDD